MYKRALLVTAILIASAALSLLLVAPISADSGSNDDFASAELIEPGPFSGSLDGASDLEDYFKFNITVGDKISISFTCSSNAFTLDLYDELETWLAGTDGASSTMNYLSYTTSAETTFSACYLVAETNSEAASYAIETFTLTQQNDGGKGSDAPGLLTGPFTVSEGAITGEVDSGRPDDNYKGEDNMDCYKFWAGSGDRINVSITTTAPDHIYMNLREPNEYYIFQDLAVKIGMTAYGEWWTANETAMGYYYIEVYQDLVPGYYSIVLDIERQNDAGTGEDAKESYLYSSIVGEGNIYGYLRDDDQGDSYKIQAGEGDVISIGFRGYSDGDFLYLDLLGSDGSVLVSNKSSSADFGNFLMYYTANETGVQNFFLKVWMDTAPGEYVITLGIEQQNDAGEGIDVPGANNTESMLVAGSYEGWIYDLDTADMYMINLTGGDILTVTMLIAGGTSASWRLLNNTLSGILAEGTSNMGTPSNSSYYYEGMMDPQTCYLKIYDGQARYYLGIALSRQNDAGSGTDAPGTASASMLSQDPLPIGPGSYSGYMQNYGDMFDSYLINVTGGHRLNITVTPSSGLGINAMLYGDGVVQYAMDLLNAQGVAAYLQYDFTVDDWAQLIVQIISGVGDYSFVVAITEIPGKVNTTPSAPVLTSTPGAMKVTLTWSAPTSDGGSPITGYKIYRKISGSLTPATLLTTVGPTVLTYIDTNVVFGSTYEYFVRATNINGEGNASNSVTGSPTQEATDTDNDGIPDSWEIMYELNPGDSADALLDPDNDGRNNLKEYQDETNPNVKDSPIADDDDDNDDDDDGFLSWVPLGGVGCCLGIIVIGIFLLIIILVVVLIIAKGRKKKDDKEEDAASSVKDEEATEE